MGWDDLEGLGRLREYLAYLGYLLKSSTYLPFRVP